MLTEKDYCDYETCVALKELGFREKCLTYYDTEDNVGLLYNTQWPIDNIPYQFIDCLESHNSNTSDDNSYIDAPTVYEAQKWLREEEGMLVDPMVFADNSIDADGKVVDRWIYYSCAILNTSTAEFIRNYDHSDEYDTYEEALSEGIKEAVKILKEEQDE